MNNHSEQLLKKLTHVEGQTKPVPDFINLTTLLLNFIYRINFFTKQ